MPCRTTENAELDDIKEKACNGDCANCGALGTVLSQLDPFSAETVTGSIPQSTQPQSGSETLRA